MLFNKNGYWYVGKRINGKLYRYKTDKIAKADKLKCPNHKWLAKREEAIFEELHRAALGLPPSSEQEMHQSIPEDAGAIQKLIPTFKEYGRYILDVTRYGGASKSGRNEETHKEMMRWFDNLLLYFRDIRIDTINKSSLTLWQNSLLRGGKSVNYIRKHRVVLNIILEYAIDDGFIDRNPLKKLYLPALKRLKTDKEKREVFGIDDINSLIAASKRLAKDSDKEIFAYKQFANFITLAAFSGMRPGEISALKWENVNILKGVIHIKEAIRKAKLGLPKDGEERIIQMLPQAKQALVAQMAISQSFGYVFVSSKDGKPFTKNENHNRKFKKVLKEAGLSDYYEFYDLKRFFATYMPDRLGSVWTQQQLGHSSFETTQIYIKKTQALEQGLRDLEQLKIAL